MPITSPGNDDDTGENHQPTLRKNTAEPVEQTLKQNIMRNNKPAAGVISPDDYRRLTEAEEDFALYLEAEERMKRDDGTRLGMDDVFGKDYKPVDDGYVPEFE